MLISMAEFAPIFWWLSLLGGALFGLLFAAAFAFCFYVLRLREVPVHLVVRTVANTMWVGLPVIVSFVIFRSAFGKYEFHPHLSLLNLIDELVLQRAQFFFSGAFVALVSTLLLFLAANAQAVLDPNSIMEQGPDDSAKTESAAGAVPSAL